MNFRSLIKKVSVASGLAYAGAIPFILAAFLMYWDLERIPVIGDVQKVIDVYGLIIVVFIAGSFWGIASPLTDKTRVYLMLISNIFTLIAFISYLWMNSIPFQLVLVVLFILLFLVDCWIYFIGLSSRNYVFLRMSVSTIVVTSLLVVFSS